MNGYIEGFSILYQARQQRLVAGREKPMTPSTAESCTAPCSLTDVLPDGSCERCYQPWEQGRHGYGICRMEPRQEFINLCGKDKLFEFVTSGWHPKLPAGLRVSGPRQWARLQRRYGVTADVSLKERVQRRTSGLLSRRQQERRVALRQKALPIVERALQAQRRITTSL